MFKPLFATKETIYQISDSTWLNRGARDYNQDYMNDDN